MNKIATLLSPLSASLLIAGIAFFAGVISSRKVHIAGIIPEPDGKWMKQVGRNLTDCMDGFLAGYRYLIHDRSSLFTKEFRSILQSGGVKWVRLPARSPNLNAFAEEDVQNLQNLTDCICGVWREVSKGTQYPWRSHSSDATRAGNAATRGGRHDRCL
jgi:hypothetical protein